MSRLRPQKLLVRFAPGVASEGPVAPRCYTLTHSDATGDLFLTVGPGYDRQQISGWYTRLMRDEVLAKWQEDEAMPSDNLLLYFQRDLRLVDHWRVDGTHYARTLRAWLDKLDGHEVEVRAVLYKAYGPDQETAWLVNWRLFFMGCEETWKLCHGQEYLVSHYLFQKPAE